VRWLIAILVVALVGVGALLLSRGERNSHSPRLVSPAHPPPPESSLNAAGAPSGGVTPPDPRRISLALDAGSLRSLPDEQRRFLQIRAAVRENRLSDMRDLARDYLRDYPHGVLRAQVESYTGVHPRPSGPDAQ